VRLSFLGTGAAGGVPLWGCDCPACKRAAWVTDHRRAPCCALVEAGEGAQQERILIDAGLMDLAERFPADSFSRILLTHYHPDHVQGLFHLRWGVGEPLPIHGPPDSEGCADLYKNPGILDFRRLRKFEPLDLGTLTVTPVPLIHSKPTLGFCIEANGARLAYLTDTVGLPPATREFLQGFRPDVLVLDCTHPPMEAAPRNHNDLNLALAICEDLAAPRTFLTHLSHDLDAWLMENDANLPEGVVIASDNKTFVLM
jgi:phosphoribosyl 1,2-cyclic phosphate phosphodiesterase